MRRYGSSGCGSSNSNRMLAGLLTGLLFAILPIPLGAQAAPASHVGRGFGPRYDAAHETTLTGTIQEAITRYETGLPAGLHLLIVSPEGMVDAHLGPFLSEDTKEALHTGTPVQIVGAFVQLHEKQYFLAREIMVGGRTITIRNTRGFLAHGHPDRLVKTGTPIRPEETRSQENGGAR